LVADSRRLHPSANRSSERAIVPSGVVKSGKGTSASSSPAIQKAWLWVKSASNPSTATS
jgi:hypothetical protein